ncbi:MAG: helix-turn-helix domain-containing protein [Sulfuricella sp.]
MEIHIFQYCHPAIATALRQFQANITPSHSTTSKSKSIFSLCKNGVEPAIKVAFDSFSPGSYKSVFNGKGFVAEARRNGRELERRLHLLASVHSNNPTFNDRRNCIHGTADTLLSLIRPLTNLKSKTSTTREGSRRARVNKGNSSDHFPYCELCWRLCESEQARIDNEPTDLDEDGKPVILSPRFCRVHDATKPGSKYRADHNHRHDFHQVIKKLTIAYKTGNYTDGIDEVKAALELEYPINIANEYWTATTGEDKFEAEMKKISSLTKLELYQEYKEPEEIIREVAYKLVRSEKPTRRAQAETRFRALALIKNGMTQSAAAREIGISRQAISKVLSTSKANQKPKSG